MSRRWMIVFAIMLFAFIAVVTWDAVKPYEMAQSQAADVRGPVIVIDAGHGGTDPGKVAIDGSLEKDINLKIAIQLERVLTEQGYEVVMTRESDRMQTAGASKDADMKERVNIANQSDALLMISIHQNSFTDEGASGPQVFYYEASEDGRELAECVQKQLNEELVSSNPRSCKADKSYYMLKNTKVTSVIVECGFLSNETDTAKLTNFDYQKKLAACLADAIVAYTDEKATKKGREENGNFMD